MDTTGATHDCFPTTNWGIVLGARDANGPRHRSSFGFLYDAYRLPLYGFLRRRGHAVAEAEDLLQGFFLRALEKRTLGSVRARQGRFRAFLLHALKNFLINEYHRGRCLKRGGGVTVQSLDVSAVARRCSSSRTTPDSPDAEFDRRWALTVMDRAMARLEAGAAAKGRCREFRGMKELLTGSVSRGACARLARELGKSETSVKVALHRLRKKLGRAVRAEVARTVTDPQHIDAEVRYLLVALAGRSSGRRPA